MRNFNKWLALHAIGIVGTMWFFYFCVIFVTIPLFFPKLMPYIQYASSGYMQLIFLPLILVAQAIQGTATQKRMDEILDLIELQQKEELKELKDDKRILKRELDILRRVRK